jgi:hypothetical protein
VTPKLYAAVRWGALIGGGLAIFETAAYLLVLSTGTAGDYDALSVFELILEWVVPLAAGLLAAREAGEIQAGVIAGLTSGVIVALISIVYQLVVPPPPELFSGGLADIILGMVLDTVMTVSLGGLGGWIGGRLGVRSRGPASRP